MSPILRTTHLTDPGPTDADTLAEVSAAFAAELKHLVRLVTANASPSKIQRARKALTALSHEWSALRWEADIRVMVQARNTTVMDVHHYVFVRGAATYECASERGTWVIRRERCEVTGPAFNGFEFVTADGVAAFERLAIEAVRGCSKACAVG